MSPRLRRALDCVNPASARSTARRRAARAEILCRKAFKSFPDVTPEEAIRRYLLEQAPDR